MRLGKRSKGKGDNFSQIRVKVKCKSPGQKELVKSINDKEVTICTGMAGTGKTYLACAQAVKLLKNDPRYEKIIIAKSVTAIPGEDVGFLKGSLGEKMDPFMWSYWTNFEKILGKDQLSRLREHGMIEVWPLAFIRGSNLDNTIAIIDEIQNISKGTMKTIITRLGTDSKMILLGDEDQIDLRRPEDSCLAYYVRHFKDFEPFGIIELTEDDEIRNPLISKYIKYLGNIKE